jgi:tetratricopeptide (TPR) repeat protein
MLSLFRSVSTVLLCLFFYAGNSQSNSPAKADTSKKDPFATLDDLNKAIQSDPLNPIPYTRRASFRRLTMKDLKGSMADCNASLTLNPKQSDLYSLRAMNEMELNRFLEGLEDIKHALRMDSTNSEAYWLRGRFEQMNNQLTDALTDFDLASKYSPQDNRYSSQKINLLSQQNEFVKALALVNEKLKSKRKDPELLLIRAGIYGKMKKYKAALSDLALVIKSDKVVSNSTPAQGTTSIKALAYFYRGVVYDSLHQGEKGIKDMKMARALGIEDAYLYILNRFPKYRDAKMALYQDLSFTLAVMESKSNYREALDTCDKAIALFPDSAMLYYMRAIYKRRLDRFTDAIADYQLTVQKDPKYSDAWMNMGLLQEHLGDSITAMKNYQEAIRTNPDNFRAYLNVGALLLDQHKYEEAIPLFKKGIACKVEETSGYMELGDCYVQLKQNDLGCEYYRMAEDLGESAATMRRIHFCGKN